MSFDSSKLIFLLASLFLVVTVPIFATVTLVDANQAVLIPAPTNIPQSREVDPRSLALKYYLESKNSPLKDYADQIVSAADQNGIDWRLLPAISAVESKFGNIMPYGKDNVPTSYNAWGWGVHSGKTFYFKSWEEGIEKVSRGLKRQFQANALTNPYELNQRYSSNPSWGGLVDYSMRDLQKYEEAFLKKFGAQIEAYNRGVGNSKFYSQLSFQISNPQ